MEVKLILPVAPVVQSTENGDPEIEPEVMVFAGGPHEVVPLNVKSFILNVPPVADAPHAYNRNVIEVFNP